MCVLAVPLNSDHILGTMKTQSFETGVKVKSCENAASIIIS